jgi:hypothetical protein
MPFAENRGGVASAAEYLGDGHFLYRERERRAVDRNQRQAGADRIAPGHQGRARRRASLLDQKLRQPQPFGGQLIETRRRRTAQFAAAVGTDGRRSRCYRRG